jgi:hypothetical protein
MGITGHEPGEQGRIGVSGLDAGEDSRPSPRTANRIDLLPAEMIRKAVSNFSAFC